jgi:hypothetical protein
VGDASHVRIRAAWTPAKVTALDEAIVSAASGSSTMFRGNIGDRDSLTYEGERFDLVQAGTMDPASWRIYLYDGELGSAVRLSPVTHGGSTAFSNPSITSLTSPTGRPAIVVTMFVPAEGAATGESGSLIYYTELP